MSGLEIMLKTIREEAAAQAQAMLDQAKADASQFLDQAQEASNASCEAILEESRRQAADIRQRAQAQGELQRRRGLLERKQQLLEQTAQAAREGILALPQEEYFSLLIGLAARSAEPGRGVMFLSPKDIERLPPGFAAQLNAALPQGAALEVSSSPRHMDGGFVLQYGDVEQNCSLAALFDELREAILDEAREALFP